MPWVTSQRDRDKAVILHVLRHFGPVSRSEIHDLTDLRHSTVSQLTKELVTEGKVIEAGPSDNPMGRKQTLLRLNPDYGVILALEFDSENAVAAVLDLSMGIRAMVKEPIYAERGLEAMVEQLVGCTRKVLQDQPQNLPLLGIGIADVGLVDRRTGVSVMTSQLDFWRNVPLAKRFGDEFGVPVILENATRCRAIAERVLGSGASTDDMVYVEYGAGIGSAIFAKGNILDGHLSIAGEIGHTHLMEGGPGCKCGSLGCLEALAGLAAIEDRFRSIYVEGSSPIILELTNGDPSKATGWMVMEAASKGDKICSVIIEQMARYLGLALSNLVNLLNPELIILDRRLEICGPAFLDQVRRMVRLQALSYATEHLDIRFGKLLDDAGVLGAGMLVLNDLLAIPELKPPRFLINSETELVRASASRNAL